MVAYSFALVQFSSHIQSAFLFFAAINQWFGILHSSHSNERISQQCDYSVAIGSAIVGYW